MCDPQGITHHSRPSACLPQHKSTLPSQHTARVRGNSSQQDFTASLHSKISNASIIIHSKPSKHPRKHAPHAPRPLCKPHAKQTQSTRKAEPASSPKGIKKATQNPSPPYPAEPIDPKGHRDIYRQIVTFPTPPVPYEPTTATVTLPHHIDLLPHLAPDGRYRRRRRTVVDDFALVDALLVPRLGRELSAGALGLGLGLVGALPLDGADALAALAAEIFGELDEAEDVFL